MSEFINPHTGEITWHKGGRGRTPNGKSYAEFITHPTAQYRMTFSQWEANRLKKYKSKKDVKAHAVEITRTDLQVIKAAYGSYKPNTEGKWAPYADQLIAVAELQFEIRALTGTTEHVLFARISSLKSQICMAVEHKRDVESARIKVTQMLEQIQMDFVKYEARIKKQADSIRLEQATKAKTQLKAAVDYKQRFATSQQRLDAWLKEEEQKKLITH